MTDDKSLLDHSSEKFEKTATSQEELSAFYVEKMRMEDRVNSLVEEILPDEIRQAKISGEEPKVPKWRLRQFIDDYKSATNYEYIHKKILDGTLSLSNVKNFAKVNPYLYQRVRLELFKEYENGGKENLKYSQKLALEDFLQITTLTNTKGGVFNVNNEASEPIGILDREIKEPLDKITGKLNKGDITDKKSASERLESL